MTGSNEVFTKSLAAVLEQRLGRQAFDTWFRPLTLVESPKEHVLTIGAPNLVVKDWIIANYGAVLQESLAESQMDGYHLEWSVSTGPDVRLPSTRRAAEKTELVAVQGVETDFGEESGLRIADAPSSALNEKYTFSRFVVAPCNQFAHAAAKAVAESPGKTYNPLYLYGGVGLGKTHLIQASGHAIKSANRHLQIAYLSLERFMNELINAIRYGYDKTRVFRERYRSIDVLLIDDVQFIAGKERTQEEFFHTFNALYDAQKQIVLTSDCPPREIPEIEERLHSRFEWGLIADIEPPDLETKIAILRRKA